MHIQLATATSFDLRPAQFPRRADLGGKISARFIGESG